LIVILIIYWIRYIIMKASLPTERPTTAEVNLRASEFNYRQIQNKIPKGVKILAVVKADADGHGAVPISLKLEKLGVELRKGGVKAPILILGGIYKEDEGRVLRYNLTPVVFQRGSLKVLTKAAVR
jgi:alanine racemase